MSFESFICLGSYQRGSSCGYCGKSDSACSFGFVTPMMKAETYESLINRGWRRYSHTLCFLIDRSGKYMYKPDLRNTCCRLYPVFLLLKRLT
jgi:arginyl-tRNA---protein transferase